MPPLGVLGFMKSKILRIVVCQWWFPGIAELVFGSYLIVLLFGKQHKKAGSMVVLPCPWETMLFICRATRETPRSRWERVRQCFGAFRRTASWIQVRNIMDGITLDCAGLIGCVQVDIFDEGER